MSNMHVAHAARYDSQRSCSMKAIDLAANISIFGEREQNDRISCFVNFTKIALHSQFCLLSIAPMLREIGPEENRPIRYFYAPFCPIIICFKGGNTEVIPQIFPNKCNTLMAGSRDDTPAISEKGHANKIICNICTKNKLFTTV